MTPGRWCQHAPSSLLPATWWGRGYTNQAFQRCCSNTHGRAAIYFLFLLSRCWHLVTSQSNTTSSLLSAVWTFPHSFGSSFGWGMSQGLQLQECTRSTCSYAHQSHVYWTAGVNEVCPKLVASLSDSVIQFWLIQGLEVRGTAGMGRLSRGIGEDGTGPCMKESNRSSLISVLCPQRNSVIHFFPHHHDGIAVILLNAEALLQEMLY